jgi:uncharacterized protein (UPF0179 family)
MDQTTLTLPQMVGEKQAAEVLAVSVAALRRWRREHRGPAFSRLERCIRYRVDDLRMYVEECSVHEAPPGSTK